MNHPPFQKIHHLVQYDECSNIMPLQNYNPATGNGYYHVGPIRKSQPECPHLNQSLPELAVELDEWGKSPRSLVERHQRPGRGGGEGMQMYHQQKKIERGLGRQMATTRNQIWRVQWSIRAKDVGGLQNLTSVHRQIHLIHLNLPESQTTRLTSLWPGTRLCHRCLRIFFLSCII